MTAAAFIGYSLLVLAVGLWASRRPQSTPAEIHLGGREHGRVTSALSSSASTESGFVLLGMVGMGYSVGANALWIVPAGIGGYLLNWLILGPRLRQKCESLEVVTVPEFICVSTGGRRASRCAAVIAGLIALAFLCAYVAAQFHAAGKALSTQFGIPVSVSVWIATALVAAYALLGGFRAVSWTDNIQAIMMLIALIVLPICVVGHVGGPGVVFDRLAEIDPNLASLTAGQTGVGALLAILPWLMLGLAYPGQPHAVARLMATRDKSVFKPAAAIAISWFILVYTGAVFLGMAARVAFSDVPDLADDPERILPILAVQFLPGIVAGIIVAAIMAAICSTADSTLLCAATTVVRDIVAGFRSRSIETGGLGNPDASDDAESPASNTGSQSSSAGQRELLFLRLVIVAIAAACAVMALRDQSGNVFGLVLYAWSGLGASLGPTTLYCALVAAPRAPAALAGLVVGTATVVSIHGHSLDLLIGFSAGLAAIVLVHFVSSRSSA